MAYLISYASGFINPPASGHMHLDVAILIVDFIVRHVEYTVGRLPDATIAGTAILKNVTV